MGQYFNNDVNKINDFIMYGTEDDYCEVCKTKMISKMKQDNTYEGTQSIYDAQDKLKKNLYTKPIVKLFKSGTKVCICQDCIKEINDIFNSLSGNNKIDTNKEKE